MAVTALLYAQTVGFEFAYEDLNDTETLFRPWAWQGWQRILTNSSFALSNVISGPSPWSWHLVSVLAHLAACAVLWSIVCGSWYGVLGLGLFALHPLQVESVAYISSRSDLLMTCAVIGGVWAMERRQWLLVLIACLAALGAKETGLVAPVLLLWWAWKRYTLSPRLAIGLGVLGGIAAGAIAYRFADAIAFDALFTLTETTKALLLATKVALPIDFSIDHDWTGVLPGVAVIATGSVGIWLLACVLHAGESWLSWAAIWAVIALGPRLLIPLLEGLHEHHFYLPMAGLGLAIGAIGFQKERQVWL